MFSLIITIISVALVAALALATLYYGGETFNQGKADAEAAQVLIQGQQVLAAAELFYLKNGRWPDTMQDLVDQQFLQSVPTAQAPAGAMAEAQAVGRVWEVATAGVPVYVLPDVDTDLCKMVNKKAFGKAGVPKKAYTALSAQCYGETPNEFTVVVAKNGSKLPEGLDPINVVDQAEPPSAAEDWTIQPDEQSGGAQGPGPSAPAFEPPPDTGAITGLRFERGSESAWEDSNYLDFRLVNTGSTTVTLSALNSSVSVSGTSGLLDSLVWPYPESQPGTLSALTSVPVSTFCEEDTIYPGEATACYLEKSSAVDVADVPSGALSVSVEYQGEAQSLGWAYNQPTAPDGAAEPLPDVIAKGVCPLDLGTYPMSMVNNTGTALTITQWAGYGRDAPPYAGIVQDSPYGPMFSPTFYGADGIVDFGMTHAYYESIWQTLAMPINETLLPGKEVMPRHYNGGDVSYEADLKGAYYIQEADAWCVIGKRSSGTRYFLGVAGSAWNPPDVMDGPWGAPSDCGGYSGAGNFDCVQTNGG